MNAIIIGGTQQYHPEHGIVLLLRFHKFGKFKVIGKIFNPAIPLSYVNPFLKEPREMFAGSFIQLAAIAHMAGKTQYLPIFFIILLISL